MPRYLLAIYHPEDYNGTKESDEMRAEISALNREMVAAGIRLHVGGLSGPGAAVAVRRDGAGFLTVTDGPYLETRELIGGLWVLDLPDRDAAIAWAKKAAAACRVPVEVRPFL